MTLGITSKKPIVGQHKQDQVRDSLYLLLLLLTYKAENGEEASEENAIKKQ